MAVCKYINMAVWDPDGPKQGNKKSPYKGAFIHSGIFNNCIKIIKGNKQIVIAIAIIFFIFSPSFFSSLLLLVSHGSRAL